MEIIFYYYYVSMNNNNKPIGSGLKAIQYLKKCKCKKRPKKPKELKPTNSPLHNRIKIEMKRSRLSLDRNINLKVNTNIAYKGWEKGSK
jgi:hypothetical protein